MRKTSSITYSIFPISLHLSFFSPTIHHVACQPWMVLAGDPGHRTPFDASLVGVCPTDHCCLSVPVRLGPSVVVATIPFSYANHPVHRWKIARVRARVLLRPTCKARAATVVCTHPPHCTFNVKRLFFRIHCRFPATQHSLRRSLRRRSECLRVQQYHIQPYSRVLHMSEPHLHRVRFSPDTVIFFVSSPISWSSWSTNCSTVYPGV